MLMTEIIEKKKLNLPLSKEEINFFIKGYVNNEIPDYQVSALLMAICFNSMTKEETFALTEAMLHSGDVIDLSKIKGVKIDKHSTGGVGDKTSLALLPLVASCGVKVAKMSGRGLGHTGGTLDKLESIKGMRINLTSEEFIKQVNDINIAIIGQSQNLVPADKKLYALRDVTATVDSLPLIASSIMSKKLAANADTILLDVKFGNGAFMKTLEDGKKLASLMVEIGKAFNKNTKAVITDMNEPLGNNIGNALEVIEAVNTLKGHGPKDFETLCVRLGGIILTQANICKTVTEGEKLIKEHIASGEGLAKLKEMVKAQGGDPTYIDNPDKFPKAKIVKPLISKHDGYIKAIDALKIGEGAMLLGAGRAKKEDSIDYASGITLTKKVGDVVKKGDVLAYIYTNFEKFAEAEQLIHDAYAFSDEVVEPSKLIYEVIE